MAHASSAVDKPVAAAIEAPPAGGLPEPRSCLSEDPFVTLYHELRSPLGLIATTARGAASECAEGTYTREQLERISRVAERALRVAETVLELARKDTDSPSGTLFSPAEMLDELIGDFAQHGTHEVRLVVQPEARATRLFGQPGHFEGMLQALLVNASDHGEIDTPIEVAFEVAGDTLCLTVDNRVAAQRRHRGLGIGSYLARRLAGELGGTLTSAQIGDEYRARFTAMVPRGIAEAGARNHRASTNVAIVDSGR